MSLYPPHRALRLLGFLETPLSYYHSELGIVLEYVTNARVIGRSWRVEVDGRLLRNKLGAIRTFREVEEAANAGLIAKGRGRKPRMTRSLRMGRTDEEILAGKPSAIASQIIQWEVRQRRKKRKAEAS